MALSTALTLAVHFITAASASAAQCSTDGSEYTYSEEIKGQTREITVTFCPNHPWKNINPNHPVPSWTTYKVPAYPVYYSSGKDLSARGGNVGVLFSGAMIFSPYGGSKYGTVTSYTNSAANAEGDTFDMCGCHGSSKTSASYHCHVPPGCLLRQLGQTDSTHSPQIGWAADGFPVYGPRGKNGVMMQTCTLSGGTVGDGTCVDDDGGLPGTISDLDSYTMRYFFLGTYNDGTSCTNPLSPLPGAEYHPSTPTKYQGCCPSGVSCSANWLPSCPGSGTSDGYASGFTATATNPNLGLACDACWASSQNNGAPSSCAAAPTAAPTTAASPTAASPTAASSTAAAPTAASPTGDDGPPECALDCPGVNDVEDVCAYVETIKDNNCIDDCAPTFYEDIRRDSGCTDSPSPAAETFVVSMTISLAGLTEADFTDSAQDAFTQSVAENCGDEDVTAEDVTIVSFSAASEKRRMLLQSGGLEVETEIAVSTYEAATAASTSLVASVSDGNFVASLQTYDTTLASKQMSASFSEEPSTTSTSADSNTAARTVIVSALALLAVATW